MIGTSIGVQIILFVLALGGAMIGLYALIDAFKNRKIAGFKSVTFRKGSFDDIRYPHVVDTDADAALKAHETGNYGPITLGLRKGFVSVRVSDFTCVEIGS